MGKSDTFGKYAIITPARNEQDFIKYAIESIITQTLKPVRWVIVNDGSTDSTGAIVHSYLKRYGFMRLINLKRGGSRNFGSKAIAFSRGLAELRDINYDFIGNLDADISIEQNYYGSIIKNFYEDPKLGIAGGIVYTKIGKRFSTSDKTLDSVGGAVQLFRKMCFEAIGGYIPLEWGGIDAAAEIKAKMLGWRVKKFPEQKVFELRRTGSAEARALSARVRFGRRFYTLGYAPVFYFLRCFYRATDHPFVIGSIAELYGFVESMIRRRPILLPPDVVAYLRGEQWQRLRNLPWSLLNLDQ